MYNLNNNFIMAHGTASKKQRVNNVYERAVLLVEPLGSTLLPIRTIYIRMSESHANIVTVSQKIKEVLDSEDTFVVTDIVKDRKFTTDWERKVTHSFY